MKKENVLREIYATRKAVDDLKKIICNAEIGLENNEFVLNAFETEYKKGGHRIPVEKKTPAPGVN